MIGWVGVWVGWQRSTTTHCRWVLGGWVGRESGWVGGWVGGTVGLGGWVGGTVGSGRACVSEGPLIFPYLSLIFPYLPLIFPYLPFIFPYLPLVFPYFPLFAPYFSLFAPYFPLFAPYFSLFAPYFPWGAGWAGGGARGGGGVGWGGGRGGGVGGGQVSACSHPPTTQAQGLHAADGEALSSEAVPVPGDDSRHLRLAAHCKGGSSRRHLLLLGLAHCRCVHCCV